MKREERRVANERFLAARAAGHSWSDAATTAGLPVKRAAAYDLERRVRLGGAAALTDGRHGHPKKFRAAVRLWLETTARAHPEYPGHQFQQLFLSHFGFLVSVSQINRVRVTLGLRYQPPKKSV